MDKNLIMLLLILALWVMVIRPMNRKTTATETEKDTEQADQTTTHESESGQTHGGGGTSFAEYISGRGSSF